MSAQPVELAFADVLDGIGRFDGGAYHASSYGGGVKHAERARVLEFMLPYFAGKSHRVKLLSFPGMYWTFESMLLAEKPGSQVVGLERSASVYHHARRAMPQLGAIGTEFGEVSERVRSYGNSSYCYARTTARVGKATYLHNGVRVPNAGKKSNRSHRLLMMCASLFTELMTLDLGASIEERRDFAQRFYYRNAVWLDFTSNICGNVESALRNLPLCIEFSKWRKPVVVTLLGARDRFHSNEARVTHITGLIPGFRLVESWSYIGKNGAPMLTVAGELQ